MVTKSHRFIVTNLTRLNDPPARRADKAPNWSRSKGAGWRSIWLADPCVYCLRAAETIDHIVPRSAGGTSAWTNSAPVCEDCNRIKGSRSLLDMLTLRAGLGPPKPKAAKAIQTWRLGGIVRWVRA